MSEETLNSDNAQSVEEFTTNLVENLYPGEIEDEVIENDTNKNEPEYNNEKPETEVKAEVKEPPQHWSDELKNAYNSLDDKAKDAFLSQAKNLENGYQKKYNDLSQERQKIIAYQGLVEKFERDKDFAEHILKYGKNNESNVKNNTSSIDVPSDNFGLGERPTDPYEAMKYDIKLESKKAFYEEYKKVENEKREENYRESINKTITEAKNDPKYEKVMEGIANYINNLPTETLQRQVSQILDTDIPSFKTMYLKIREEMFPENGQVETAKTTNNAVGKEKQPIAPMLESGGAAEDIAVNKTKQSKAQLREEAIRGNPEPYLEDLVKRLYS